MAALSVSRRNFVASLGSAVALTAFGAAAVASVACASEHVSITPSPDKYTWYVKDYRGLNAAAIGYTSLGGDRMDSYGAGHLELIYVASDGSYIDYLDEEELKNYKVFAQNLAPNTEMKFTFMTDSQGNEYDNLVGFQTVEQIVLAVCRVGETPGDPVCMTAIEPSIDKHYVYVRDYVGRNLASCGYTSLGGEYRDSYAGGSIELVLTAEDGSYIDPTDTETMKNYVVTWQGVEPNTQIAFTYMTDSEGNEYDNLIQSASIEAVDLYVAPVAASGGASAEGASGESGEVSAELKELLDSYESFMNDYCDFMLYYVPAVTAGDTAVLADSLAEYAGMVAQQVKWVAKVQEVDQEALPVADLNYYAEVTARVSQRLAEVVAAL